MISGTEHIAISFIYLFLYRPDEAELFAKSAQHIYIQFRDKAALSRSLTVCFGFNLQLPAPLSLSPW